MENKRRKFGGYLFYAWGIVCSVVSIIEKRSWIWMVLSILTLIIGIHFLTTEQKDKR